MNYDGDSERLTFWKKQLVLQNEFVQVLESYATVCPIEIPSWLCIAVYGWSSLLNHLTDFFMAVYS